MHAGTLLLAFAACAEATPTPDSVRDRLESSETQLIVSAAESGGSITARRRTSEGWVSGTAELTIERGELVVTADERGAITIERLAVDLAPITIPESVLGYEAQLTDVHLQAERPAGVVTTWRGDDEVRAVALVPLELSWSLTIDGKTSPLGAPRLRPVPVELSLSGDAAAIRAELRARSTGMFWSWADLLKLEDLDLFLAASTATL